MHKVHFFVAAMGFSGYPYCEAFRDGKTASRTTAHIHAFEYYGAVPRILTQQTLEKLNWMRLTVMAKEFRHQSEDAGSSQLTFDERFGMLVDAEWTARQNKHLERLFLKAGMRQNTCLENLDCSYGRGLKRETIQHLSTCAWMWWTPRTVRSGWVRSLKLMSCNLPKRSGRDFLRIVDKRTTPRIAPKARKTGSR